MFRVIMVVEYEFWSDLKKSKWRICNGDYKLKYRQIRLKLCS